MDKETFIEALTTGNSDVLRDIDAGALSPELLEDPGVVIGLARAADHVVSHRPSFRAAVARAVELGVPCDIWTAARAGLREEVERQLAQEPALLEAKDRAGRTALQRAALVYGVCEECEAVADSLIGAGARIDVFTAATFGMPEVIDAELQRDPAVVGQRCQGSTPLNWAVRPRRNYEHATAICASLLAAGANANDRDQDESGMTPLHHVAEWGAPVCVELVDPLLQAGADINATDDRGWTPLVYAMDRKRREMVNCLTERKAIG